MRTKCPHCFQPDFSCFCNWIEPFDPGIDFVILTHPIEVKRRRIATGRLAHLCLRHSIWIMGDRFHAHARLEAVIADPNRACFMLYPGRNSANLSHMSIPTRNRLSSPSQRLTVIVIDGTWGTAQSTVNQSTLLKEVPRICFTPPGTSNFRIRRQPRPECYSTIEAIHHTIELLEPSAWREHDHLLRVFERMVDHQLELTNSHLDLATTNVKSDEV